MQHTETFAFLKNNSSKLTTLPLRREALVPVVDNAPGSIAKVGVAACNLEFSLSLDGIKHLCNTNDEIELSRARHDSFCF